MAALTLSELMGLRDELVRQFARGVLSVKDGDEEVSYATPAAMQRAIAALESRISAMQATPPNVLKFSVKKGI